MRCLITGAGGFLGGHLVKRLLNDGHQVRAVDIKPIGQWYQVHRWPWSHSIKNLCLDLREEHNCRRACEDMEEVYQLAAEMGGIGKIENDRIGCLRNAIINDHMIESAYNAGCNRYFFSSSACIYNTVIQENPELAGGGLKEDTAYPAMSERGYGWEKLMAEMVAQEYWAERGMKTFIARLFNVYGPFGTWDGGKEKAPAAICRKVIEARHKGTGRINIWGDGTRCRNYTWIDDCIEGICKIMHCDSLIATPVNLGSTEMVTVNQLVDLAESFAELPIKLNRIYQLEAAQGVVARNSDNTRMKQYLSWEPTTPLAVGLKKTYDWIDQQWLAREAGDKVIQ